jgi:hypothetical protein
MNELQQLTEIVRIASTVPHDVASIAVWYHSHTDSIGVNGYKGPWEKLRQQDFLAYGYTERGRIATCGTAESVLCELRVWLAEIGYTIPEQKNP